MRNPDKYLTEIYSTLGLDPARTPPKRGVALKAFNNKKYHKQYCERLRENENARHEHGELSECAYLGIGFWCNNTLIQTPSVQAYWSRSFSISS